MREILQSKNIALENIEHSAIEIDQMDERVVKLSLKDDHQQAVTKFSLHLQDQSEC